MSLDAPPVTDCSELGSQPSIDVTMLSAGDAFRPLSTSSTHTIAEEVPEPHSSLYFLGSSLSGITSTVPSAHFEFSQAHKPQVHIADWEEDAGGEVMRRYYALWKEALDIVQQSKQGWIPTSSFKPPQDPVAIQAFYDYSVQTYTQLPLELFIRHPGPLTHPPMGIGC
ncbi:hypothetical protein BS47DRAFT_1396115 [Hydnum rufescens UP504]|uniref:Uncharacterized protein n=1 Tax=Hydnum rufescens UP504 TaxID=1448309 RepID=A0A9P6ARR9_9AGAM|nr:hypothetical protein BS47DRAFT_1396115 [Hydnum rufescens UP504]